MVSLCYAANLNRMSSLKMSLGKNIEREVCHYLEKHGLHKVCHNFRCRLGEIDLIMRDDKILVFVEVRYRLSGAGAASVDAMKQQRLIKTAYYYLQTHSLFNKCTCRFDVVAVTHQQQQLVFDWIKNAFLVLE